MPLTYAVADLHGRADLLDEALARVADHAARQGGSHSLVFLGDYVDRGPASRAILDRLMAGPSAGWRWICLKGNHEAMMAQAIAGTGDPYLWIDNGGDATLRNFASRGQTIAPREIPAAYLAWIGALPLFHCDAHRIFVHAGLNGALPLEQQTEDDLLWRRDQGPGPYRGRHVVHGHTPDRRGPRLFLGRTNLDTLAWQTGRLVVGVFDDDRAGGPVDFIEVLR